jgi:serine phosphatase RsbU (regulator of sigma subunit)
MDGMDISFCVYDIDNRSIQWSGANNPLWLIKKATKELLAIKPDKQPIGYWHNTKPFTVHNLQLEKGDSLYFFTDGFQDQFGGLDTTSPQKKFKPSGIRNMLHEASKLEIHEQQEFVSSTFYNWKNTNEQVDDVTFIGIQVI